MAGRGGEEEEQDIWEEEDGDENIHECLPVPSYYGHLCSSEGDKGMVPNFVIVSHLATSEDLGNVLLRFWGLHQPELILKVVGVSMKEDYDPVCLSALKGAIARSVMKRDNLWIVTEGGNTTVGRLVGEIATMAGFEGRSDIAMIGVQGASAVKFEGEGRKADAINLGRVVDKTGMCPKGLTHNLMVNLSSDLLDRELYFRKLERTLEGMAAPTGLVVVESRHKTDPALVLRHIRRQQRVIVATETRRDNVDSSVGNVGTACVLYEMNLARQKIVDSRERASRPRGSTLGYRRSTGGGGRDGAVHTSFEMQALRMPDQEWLQYALRFPDLAEIAQSGLVFLVHLGASAFGEMRHGLESVLSSVPPRTRQTFERERDEHFETGLVNLLSGSQIRYASLNTDDLQNVSKDDFEHLMAVSWDLELPRCFSCVIGNLDDHPLSRSDIIRLESHLFHAVAKFSSAVKGWVFCSGLQQSIELLLGKAVEETELSPPLLGISSLKSFDARTQRVAYDPNRFDEVPGLDTALNQSISHLLLMEGDVWDSDDADALVLQSLSQWYNHSIPILVFLVGGGRPALTHLRAVVSNEIPLFVFKGTGGLADEVAEILETAERGHSPLPPKGQPAGPEHFRSRFGIDADLVQLLVNSSSSSTMSTPVFPVQPELPPAVLGEYVMRLFRSQTTLSLKESALGDRGCWAVSRSISTLNIPDRCRLFFERSHNGRLRFKNTGNVAPFVVLHKQDSKENVASVLLKAWNLESPRLIMSITGSAVALWDEDTNERLLQIMAKGVYEAAAELSAWVVTGGTQAGCMELAGHASQASGHRGAVPTIGVAVRDMMRGCRALECSGKDVESATMQRLWLEERARVRMEDVLGECGQSAHLQAFLDAKATTAADFLSLKESKQEELLGLLGDAKGKVARAVKTLADPDPNHTHFLFVKGRNWGDEVNVRSNVEDFIVNTRIMVVIGGGENTWKTVLTAVRKKDPVPLIVFRGVGGVSEVIARHYEEHDNWIERMRDMALGDFDIEDDSLTEEACDALREILGDCGDLIEVVDPLRDSPRDVEIKIMSLASKIGVGEGRGVPKVEGRSDVVLPLHFSMMQHLDLSGNNIGDQGIALFARYLEYNTSLVEVDLDDNEITERGAVLLARALVRNKALRQLTLTNNDIDESGKHVLDCVVFSRGEECMFSENHASDPFGVGVDNQIFVMDNFFRGWVERVGEEVDEDQELREQFGEDFEDNKMQLLAWPIHTAVRYPSLLQELLVELVDCMESRSDFEFIKAAQDFDGRTILHRAVEGGFIASVHHLLTTPRLVIKKQLRVEDSDGLVVYQRALVMLSLADQQLHTTTEELETAGGGPESETGKRQEDVQHAKVHRELAASVERMLHKHRGVRKIRRAFANRSFFLYVLGYLLFLTIGTLVAFNSSVGFSQDRFRLRQAVVDTLLRNPAEDAAYYEDFYDIGEMGDVGGWIQGPLLDGVWPEETLTNSFFTLSENRIVGAVRIRQQRVRGEECERVKGYSQMIFSEDDAGGGGSNRATCYPPYHDGKAEKAPFHKANLARFNLTNDGSEWRSAKDLGYGKEYRAQGTSTIRTWDGSGYAIDIPSGDRDTAAAVLDEIVASEWIDRQTRALFIEASFYNANLKAVLHGVMGVELPAAAGAVPWARFVPMPARRYDFGDRTGVIFFVLEMAFLFFSFLFFLQEFHEVSAVALERSHKKRTGARILRRLGRYISSDWNSIDVVNVVLLCVWISFRLDNYRQNLDLLDYLDELDLRSVEAASGRFQFVNMATLADRTLMELDWLALVIVLYWIKLLKFITQAPGVGPVVGAIVRCMFDFQVVIFAMVLALVMIAFTIGFFIAFGQLTEAYNSFQESIRQIGFITLGDYDFDSLSTVAPIFGPVMFFMVVLVGGLVMLNIFIAVISEVYSTALESASDDWDDDLTERMTKYYTRGRMTVLTRVRKFLHLPVDEEVCVLPWTERTRSLFQEFEESQSESSIRPTLEDIRSKVARIERRVVID